MSKVDRMVGKPEHNQQFSERKGRDSALQKEITD